jgi:hypothetical protein
MILAADGLRALSETVGSPREAAEAGAASSCAATTVSGSAEGGSCRTGVSPDFRRRYPCGPRLGPVPWPGPVPVGHAEQCLYEHARGHPGALLDRIEELAKRQPDQQVGQVHPLKAAFIGSTGRGLASM